MTKKIINNAVGAIPPLPTFSQAVILNKTVYVSGSIGSDVERNILGGFQIQARAALDNLKAVLEGAGSSLEHVVKVNAYLTYLARDFDAFNDIYCEYFPDEAIRPARTTVGVAALPFGAFVEIECVAELAE